MQYIGCTEETIARRILEVSSSSHSVWEDKAVFELLRIYKIFQDEMCKYRASQDSLDQTRTSSPSLAIGAYPSMGKLLSGGDPGDLSAEVSGNACPSTTPGLAPIDRSVKLRRPCCVMSLIVMCQFHSSPRGTWSIRSDPFRLHRMIACNCRQTVEVSFLSDRRRP